MLGLGPLLEDEKAKEISAQWGKDTVHLLPAAYEITATAIENDVSDTWAPYRGPQHAEKTICAEEVLFALTGAKSGLPAPAEGAGPGAAGWRGK